MNEFHLFLSVGCDAKRRGIMFLNEVALGKEHEITRDNGSLRAAPKGKHSVIARGQTEPGKLIHIHPSLNIPIFFTSFYISVHHFFG